MRQVTYGEGGFDPSQPNGNIVEDGEVPDDAPADPAVVAVTVDPAALDDARAAADSATTVAGLRTVVSDLIDLLNPNVPNA